eukprot:CAMPEP_0183588024 /NCGR_PEP_ID=MMETSP0371-20130417/160080_1 /TAXON_ID=268820 /ORGANISM="Peridinium aciculiferum, Strain PAER-2" /LENGTH=186 /DNA_ID=CAMNT_0025799255 /DNA_START=37 /DNA_END=594 /DNA_ORIENTATION=-
MLCYDHDDEHPHFIYFQHFLGHDHQDDADIHIDDDSDVVDHHRELHDRHDLHNKDCNDYNTFNQETYVIEHKHTEHHDEQHQNGRQIHHHGLDNDHDNDRHRHTGSASGRCYHQWNRAFWACLASFLCFVLSLAHPSTLKALRQRVLIRPCIVTCRRSNVTPLDMNCLARRLLCCMCVVIIRNSQS